MIDKSFIDRIKELALEAEPPVVIPYPSEETDRVYYRGREIFDNQPSSFETATLDGFVEVAEAIGRPELFAISIDSPTRVLLWGDEDRHARNAIRAECQCPNRSQFPFEQWLTQQDFMTMAQACFVQTDTLADVLKVIGTLKAGAVTTYEDDGVSQQVSSAAGVERVQSIEVPNPVGLSPYRTFLEVEQPESQFVLRLQGGDERSKPTMGLYQVVDGEWVRESMMYIKIALEERLRIGGINDLPIFV